MTLVKFKNQSPAAYPTLNTWFDDILSRGMGDVLGRDLSLNRNAVNVRESEDAFYLDVAAPGLKRENFQLSLEANTLTITARQEESSEETKEQSTFRYTRSEWTVANFERSFTLPNTVNQEAITANYAEGVLTITLPKRDEAKAKAVRTINIG